MILFGHLRAKYDPTYDKNEVEFSVDLSAPFVAHASIRHDKTNTMRTKKTEVLSYYCYRSNRVLTNSQNVLFVFLFVYEFQFVWMGRRGCVSSPDTAKALRSTGTARVKPAGIGFPHTNTVSCR